MSRRHAYRISVTTKDSHLYERLKERLNSMFYGYIEETEYGIYAQDSPGVDSVFEDGPPYITEEDIKTELTRPAYDTASWKEFTQHRDKHNLSANHPSDTPPYAEIIDTIILEYANDTSGKRTEKEITLDT